MPDKISRKRRSANMSRIRGRDTKPELIVRSTTHRMGYRFRLHHKALPGKPDLVFPKYRKVIFVHGCFWHRHPQCSNAVMPRSNTNFWSKKLLGNVERDQRHHSELKALGWDVLVVWECEIANETLLRKRIKRFLGAKLS